jgi:hypothetical protein
VEGAEGSAVEEEDSVRVVVVGLALVVKLIV